ncbi:glycoside hydrolase family 130 protein [Marinilabilia rubra]|uniref:Glycosidase n=1 Tax=Marinilabilia rubra TaxID=2162893 RepID=A0A2U2B794_9BACT|nr:glycosidase [Marinilabilia rubra]PWD98949.1 glycosidase [Marinilabilia rubra]
MKLEKFKGNPILEPNSKNHWENLVVCNPGAYYDKGKFYLLYRAAGDDEDHIIRFGLAESDDGFTFSRVSDDPVLGPSSQGPDSGCVEDARIVKFDEYYYVTYAFRPFAPGQYWKFAHDVVLTKDYGANAPLFVKNNVANTALAITKDFKNWQKLGRITQSNLDDRDVILFPEKINGKYAMLHRPKEWIGEDYGTEYPAVWLRFSDDMLVWNEPSHLIIAGKPGTWEEKTGGSTPPLKTAKGWLVLYHGVETGGTGYYRVGAVMLDLNDPTKVIGRTRDYIMEPEHWYEKEGFYQGCVFPTGNMIVGDTLYVYYGGADKYIGVATCNVNELLDFIQQS